MYTNMSKERSQFTLFHIVTVSSVLLSLITIVVILTSATCNVGESQSFFQKQPAEVDLGQSDEWDMIIFSQQWPTTSCIAHKDKKHGAACNLYKNVTSWTVHGMWPTKKHTKGPTSCNSTWKFDESKIVSLEPQLLKYWTNIYADTAETSLWEHEWSKHGTCAAQLPSLDSEYKYFQKGLKWAVLHDLRSALSLYNVDADDTKTYTSDQIFSAVIDMFNVDPVVNCIYHKEKKIHLLSQIKLCFNKQLMLVTCEDVMKRGESEPPKHRGNCPEQGIVYPKDIRVYFSTSGNASLV